MSHDLLMQITYWAEDAFFVACTGQAIYNGLKSYARFIIGWVSSASSLVRYYMYDFRPEVQLPLYYSHFEIAEFSEIYNRNDAI